MSGVLPTGWAWSPLDVLVDNFDGKRIPLNMNERAERKGEFPYYGASGVIDSVDKYLFDGDFLLISEDGANLLARNSPIAFSASGKFWVNNHAHVVAPKEGIPIGYLAAFLNKIDLAPFVTGTAQPKLTQRAMNTIGIPVPPLNEQRRILVKLDALRERWRRVAAELVAVLQSSAHHRQSVYGHFFPEADCSTSLATVTLLGPQNGLYKPLTSYGSGFQIVRIDSIRDGLINEALNRRVQVDHSEAEKYKLAESDVLINRVNSMSHLGKSAIVKGLSEHTLFESNMMRLRINTNIADPEYIALFLQSPTAREQLRKNAKQAVNQASINQQDVLGVQIPLPALPEQQRTVRRLEALFAKADAVETQVKEAQAQLKMFEQAILAKAFRGELVPQDRNDEPASVLLDRIRADRAASSEKGTGKRGRSSKSTEAAG